MGRALLAVFVAFVFSSCVWGPALRTQGFYERDEVSGTFDVILFGGTHLDDFETVAILDVAGDGYEFKPFAPEFRYKTLKGLPAKEAIEESFHHVSFHRSQTSTSMKRIISERGETIGYEVRPLYSAINVGMSDVLDVTYWHKEGGRVKVEVRLNRRFEKQLDNTGEGYIWGN